MTSSLILSFSILSSLTRNSTRSSWTLCFIKHPTCLTSPAGRDVCSYLLPPAWYPGPPGSWLSPPPPGRAFQTGCQPWWTTPHYRAHTQSNTPSTVSDAVWEISLSLSPPICPCFSPLSAKTAPRSFLPLHLLLTCMCISYAWLSVFSSAWMNGDERGLGAWAKKEGGGTGEERGREEWCFL